MTGACIGHYSDEGIVKCMITLPWWACAIILGVLFSLAIVLESKK